MERAFRFLKSTSVSCAGVGEGLAVTEADALTGGTLGEAGEGAVAIGDGPVVGRRPGCVSSCAGNVGVAQIEKSKANQHKSRLVMRRYHRVLRL